jgi:uncharacterized protein
VSVVEVIGLGTAGVAFGAMAGLLGIGGGVFIVPFLVLGLALSQQDAEATSLAVVVPSAIAASALLQRRGVGDLRLGLRIGAMGVAGAVAGAFAAIALPTNDLRLVFSVFLAIVGARMVVRGLRVRSRQRATGGTSVNP